MYSPYSTEVLLQWVSPFGNPRIDGYLLLLVAYRSLSRPSSAPDAKAFTLCSCSLELPLHYLSILYSLLSNLLELLEFLKHGYLRSKKVLYLLALLLFPSYDKIVFTL